MWNWLPWWAWGIVAAGAAVAFAAGFGNKAGGGVALAFILAVLGLRQKQAGYEARKKEEEDAAWKTRERMDNAEIHDDPDLARRWLESRGMHGKTKNRE